MAEDFDPNKPMSRKEFTKLFLRIKIINPILYGFLMGLGIVIALTIFGPNYLPH